MSSTINFVLQTNIKLPVQGISGLKAVIVGRNGSVFIQNTGKWKQYFIESDVSVQFLLCGLVAVTIRTLQSSIIWLNGGSKQKYCIFKKLAETYSLYEQGKIFDNSWSSSTLGLRQVYVNTEDTFNKWNTISRRPFLSMRDEQKFGTLISGHHEKFFWEDNFIGVDRVARSPNTTDRKYLRANSRSVSVATDQCAFQWFGLGFIIFKNC